VRAIVKLRRPPESGPWPNPPHLDELLTNVQEVANLAGIHGELLADKRGRPRDVEVLHKSAVVLLVACWEAYVEDLASTAFRRLLDKARSPVAFPSSVLTAASRPLRASQDERDVWKLADTGWRDVLREHCNVILARHVGKLNTPKPDQVDSLFEQLLGLSSLSSSWHWKGASVTRNKRRLEQLITLRGEIAHRVRASRGVRKTDAAMYYHFVWGLAVTSSNRVADFLKPLLGDYPWKSAGYGGIG